MKKIILSISALLLCSSALFSQGLLDAYRYAQSDLTGTARHLSMGGAFGALGGDISVMSTNPAGLGVYRSSEIVATLSTNAISTTATGWDETSKMNNTRLKFDNFAYVNYFPTSNYSGVIGWNLGFSYNRLKNFDRSYTARGLGFDNYSLTDYMAERASGTGYHSNDLLSTDQYDPYANRNIQDWLTILGYNAVFIDSYNNNPREYFSAFGDNDKNGNWQPFSLNGRELRIQENGAIDQYNVAFGMNISDILFLGADLAFTDINYKYNSFYRETFENNNNLSLENWLKTEGSGYQFNAGFIVRPIDFLRLGIAYNSPTWYKLSDTFSAEAYSNTTYWPKEVTSYAPDNTDYPGIYEYKFNTYDKWLFSAAAIIGQTALLSVDYEIANYQRMSLYDIDGLANQVSNNNISKHFSPAGTLRIGGEVKVTPQFAIRAGAALIGNPVNNAFRNGDYEVATVGTIPHYAIENSITNYSAGLGYRFTPNFYMDLACVLKSQQEKVYAFSNIFDQNGQYVIESKPATLKTESTRLALTLGYKF